jgi:uncharacterized protein
MNAIPSPAHSSSAADDVGVDPSMEEILASIRRIIADDQAPQQSAARASAARTMHMEPAPVIEPPQRREEPRFADAGEDLRLQRDHAPAPRVTIDAPTYMEPPTAQAPPQPMPTFAPAPVAYSPAAQSAAAHSPVAHAPAVRQDASGTALLSPVSDASVASSFEALARTSMLQNSNIMEEAVRDMLRPMLKQWLDDNLPVIVERLVRAEIERVARGGR